MFVCARRGALLAPLLALLQAMIAGCDLSASTAATATATPITTQSPTVTQITPTAVPISTSTITIQSCAQQLATAPSVPAGDLLLGQGFSGYAYPRRQIPDGTPLTKPLRVDAIPAGVPATNPRMQEGGGQGGGYVIDVCNTSATRAHTITSVTVRIAALSPYGGMLSEWDANCGREYDASTGRSYGGGCGGGPFTPCETMHATFASDASAGATVSAAQVSSGRDLGPEDNNCPQFGPLPVSLPPGQALDINVGMTVPSTPGAYTFAFGIAVEGANPAFISATPTLFAPVAHEWDGGACATPAMQVQIPPASTPTYYICPPA